jgi:hypothetical protein
MGRRVIEDEQDRAQRWGALREDPEWKAAQAEDEADGPLIAELGAEYVLLDTNPNDPHDPRPVAEDWRILERVADRWMR